ncbi:rubrerythrin [Budviciaceae bacterium CWB-B4]|uniref:Rubrerythrin n=1 Tax=Limnobaculum xujianqingii TaxID=2738837 RepID=A0A9D7AGJ2_9GAMM|nr:ferritin family protein [Limnobaculum xujianqingii]MBK5072297.1 rubrerythrin [Limnobaculum xujianqingii]MBK5175606.1 rubrerythrin [Limnobaculum xujianqingii]
MKNFSELSEKEILALAISLEEEDHKIYNEFAEGLRETYPDSAKIFELMSQEENGHRHRLIKLYQEKFGNHIPLIRRQDVKGFVERKPIWLSRPLSIDKVRKQSEVMEIETQNFYYQAAHRTTDAAIRQLLDDLAAEEHRHQLRAEQLEKQLINPKVQEKENKSAHRLFVLQIVQPSLAGLMDGSVSTLAPVFAAALATKDSWQAFLVGLAASLGAGISMAFAEAVSDNGSLTGRGNPWLRGASCGVMTTLGGLGHTLPFLISDFWTAMIVSGVVVIFELAAISWIRNRYMDTPFLQAAFQVVVGGLLVFATGLVIGSS